MKQVALMLSVIVLAMCCAGVQLDQPERTPAALRFAAVELWIDTQGEPLAAYQLEFKPARGQSDVKIVGIEGAAPGSVFADPPYYDPTAMMGERVIIADFSTAAGSALPRGKFRLATIHVQITGEAQPEYTIEQIVAATTEGRNIAVVLSLNTGNES